MRIRNYDKILFENHIHEAYETAFSGWDFSYITKHGGNKEDPAPWSYKKEIISYLNDDVFLLDMGTGGGEFLSSLKPLPRNTYATESHEPNVPIAKNRLEPLGIKVIQLQNGDQENSLLPFKDNFFDLIINRHEYYDSKEVYRILKPNSIFITQQVGYKNNETLRMIFGSIIDEEGQFHKKYYWDLQTAIDFLEKAGFNISNSMEHIGYSRLKDIRAVTYLLKIIPWEFPNFSIEKYKTQLYNIYAKIVDDGFFETKMHRFFIIAKKD